MYNVTKIVQVFMIYISSQDFFENSLGPQPGNTFKARLTCIKDFLKKLFKLPLALIGKICKTALRFVGVIVSSIFISLTLGYSRKGRQIFVERVICFAKDLADWALLPFALVLCFLRLLLALLFHPHFYFNAF